MGKDEQLLLLAAGEMPNSSFWYREPSELADMIGAHVVLSASRCAGLRDLKGSGSDMGSFLPVKAKGMLPLEGFAPAWMDAPADRRKEENNTC